VCMVSVSPSPALLNARLTAKYVDLEQMLRGKATENRDLRQEKAGLIDRISALSGRVSTLEETNKDLVAHLKRILGGRGKLAATLPEGQGLLFAADSAALSTTIENLIAPAAEELPELDADDAQVPDAETPTTKAPKQKRGRSRRKIDESNLALEIKRSERAPDDRRCPTTGVELVEVGVRVTKGLDYKRAQLVRVEHHQVIYGPAPEVAKERKIAPLLAPAPKVAVEGVTATPALLAWLLCQKYVLHLPLYRQEEFFQQAGLFIRRSTLCDWV